MERVISVIPVGQSKVDHLERCCQIFWPNQTKTVCSICFLTKISGIWGLNKKAPLDSDFANVFCINAIFHEYSFSQYTPEINTVLSMEYNGRRRGVLDSTVWMILRCTRTGVPHGVGQTGMNCFCIN